MSTLNAVKRRVFFSFHYAPDNWRAAQVRNMGVVEGNAPLSDNAWESVTRGGERVIRRWIDDQMHGRSCAVVLIGSKTAGRKWVEYEIEKAWTDGKGLLGIYIHNLEGSSGNQSEKGRNPFEKFLIGKRKFSTIVRAYDPPYKRSTNVYAHINENIADWIEEALQIRRGYDR
ncbi:MAG: TIR domain-containing protein [Gammaproteobacteria bacterium]|nr:TIR domain-containing protein [Gammaproteobacteria bacterium]